MGQQMQSWDSVCVGASAGSFERVQVLHFNTTFSFSLAKKYSASSVFNQWANQSLLGSANQQTLRTSQARRRLSSPVKNLINIFITLKRFCLPRQPHRVTRHKHPHYSRVLSCLPSPKPLHPLHLLFRSTHPIRGRFHSWADEPGFQHFGSRSFLAWTLLSALNTYTVDSDCTSTNTRSASPPHPPPSSSPPKPIPQFARATLWRAADLFS